MKKLPLLLTLLVCLFPFCLHSQSVLTVSNTGDSGAGSLRQAVASANNGDTIRFTVRGQITLNSGSINYNKNLIIEGPGKDSLSISANEQSQIFRITGGYSWISKLTLKDGFYNSPSNTLDGGGGMYFSGDSLRLDEVCIRECRVRRSVNGSPGRGGGLFAVTPKIAINDCRFTRDTVDVQAGTANGGGAWISSAQVSMNDTRVDSNYAYALRGNTGATSFGGGLFFSGNNGTQTLKNCQIRLNNCESRTYFLTSATFDAGNYGGGIYGVNANLELEDCRISENWLVANATDDERYFGAGIAVIQGTILANRVSVALNRSELQVAPSLIQYGDGGGVYIDDGGLRMDSSRVDSNFAYRGAGILVNAGNQASFQGLDLSYTSCNSNVSFTPFASSGPPAACIAFREPTFSQDSFRVLISYCEFSQNNSAAVDIRFPEGVILKNSLISENFGGLNLFGANVDPTLLENNTFNRNISNAGGGIFAFSSGPVLVSHCSFVNDSTTNSTYGREIRAEFASQFQLKNNIFDRSFSHPGGLFSFDGNSSIGSAGGNISRDNTGITVLTQTSDLNNTNPQLDAFANHGGPSFSWSLMPNSVAIDHAGTDTLTVDQRGFIRDSLLDAGAYEYNAINPYLPVIVLQSDSLNLCQGDSGTFFVSVTGPMPMDYQWQLNGLNLSGATDSLLGIPGVNPGSDTYRCIVTNIYGSDTSSNILVSIFPTYQTNLTDTICQGDSVFFGGVFILNSGIYADTLNSIQGCDSLLSLELFVAPVYAFAQSDSICSGDSVLFQGQSFSAAGTYSIPYLSQFGCDSSYTLNLSILSLPGVLINNFNLDTVCLDGGQIPLPAAIPSGGTYFGNGVSGGSFDPAQAGVGEAWIGYSFTDANGCTGMDSVSIFVKNCVSLREGLSQELHVWPNPNDGHFFIEYSGLGLVQASLYNLQGQLAFRNRNLSPGKNEIQLPDLSKGIYLLKLEREGRVTFEKIILK